MTLNNRLWFQVLQRLWRPLQQWGLGIATVSYAFRPVFELSFEVPTFTALAGASGVGFLGRGIEKVAQIRTVAKHAPHKLPIDTPTGGA